MDKIGITPMLLQDSDQRQAMTVDYPVQGDQGEHLWMILSDARASACAARSK